MKIIICGFGSAGYSAAMSIKRFAPKTDITVIDPKSVDLVHPCGLPYALEGIVRPEYLMQDINLRRSGIEKIKGKAERIYPDRKEVSIVSESGNILERYDSLIIATGNRPLIPGIAGIDEFYGRSLFTLAGINDLQLIKERAEKTATCAVIGGGAIGIETAFALKKIVPEVTLIEMREQLLPGILDPDIAGLVEDYLESLSIHIVKEKTVSCISDSNGSMNIMCGDDSVKAGIAVLAAGFKPDITLAESSGLDASSAGIKTDAFLKTSGEDIYAAGDCMAGWSTIDGKAITSRLATSAYKQGGIAGVNAAGGKNEYRGTSGTFVTKIGELEIAGTGLTSSAAMARGFEPLHGKITSKVRPEYYPDNHEITIKIIFDMNTGIVLGAQCAGYAGAAARINIISMAIEFGITIDELVRVELAYCPSVSEVYDPLLRAADFGLRRLRK